MYVTSENIAMLTPVFKATEGELAKFISQLARLESKPFVFFAYEGGSCNFDFVKFISCAAKKNRLSCQICGCVINLY